MVKDNRIDILDSYRFIAILSVMLYHYYSRWTPPINNVSLYPYGSKYDHFSYGNLGVQFFFIISGFVIAFTLTRTDSFIDFWKKRIIRLLPSMFICSFITLVVFKILDTKEIFPDSHSIKNFLFSISFFPAEFYHKFIPFSNSSVNYINGSYWTLWPEIQFYFIASSFYFVNKKNFVINISIFTILIFTLNYLTLRVLDNVQSTNRLDLNISDQTIESYKYSIIYIFNFVIYSLYFLSGVLFFQLYAKKNKRMSIILLCICFLLLIITNGGFNLIHFSPIHLIFIMYLLFVGFIYFPKQLNFITMKPISNIGVASYSLYLIHEVIGVLLINKYADIFGKYDYVFPIFVILLMVCFALLSFKYIEKPIGSYLKRKLIQ